MEEYDRAFNLPTRRQVTQRLITNTGLERPLALGLALLVQRSADVTCPSQRLHPRYKRDNAYTS